MDRRIPLSSTVNTRDLGGYGTEDGKTTKFGRVLRSEVPLVLNAEDIALLSVLGIETAIDLRSCDETIIKPSAFAHNSQFQYYSCPFRMGNRHPLSRDEIPELYGEILADFAAMRSIMRNIANQEGGVLFHCAFGKDRTGIVAAVMLLISHVKLSDILADYQVSYTYLRFLVRELHESHPELPRFIGRSDMEDMEITLEHFVSQYGDAETYLQTIGLTPNEIYVLQNKLF